MCYILLISKICGLMLIFHFDVFMYIILHLLLSFSLAHEHFHFFSQHRFVDFSPSHCFFLSTVIHDWSGLRASLKWRIELRRAVADPG